MILTVVMKDNIHLDFKEYHSSKDNLNFVKSENIFRSLSIYQKLIEKIENQIIYQSTITKGEVMLSKHNLYPKIGGDILPGKNNWSNLDIVLWLLFLADSTKPIKQISNFLKISEENILKIYENFEKKKLVYRV